MAHRIGVDIGGSFTDFAVLDEQTKEVRALKVFSRPDSPGAEVLTGIAQLTARYGIKPEDISYFTHGTTVGVNTVIQKKGLRLALFTTADFCDVLELGRLKLPNMFDLLSRRPAPLIPRERVFGIRERLLADGSVDVSPDEDDIKRAVNLAIKAGAEGIVIAFLHSYRNGMHETAVKKIVREIAPTLPVFCSSEVWPIIREYERTMTAVIDGYVQPRVAHYLASLQAALKEAGVMPEPRITKSNGGVMTAEQGKRDSVQMILSGTASGVIGAAFVAQSCGLNDCMSLDIGGTSADVAIITDGKPRYGIGEYIGDYQIYIPSVSVTSIGEGGGSIAWIDSLGVLKVGPDSAGSTPGPACYGRGGKLPTITDAFAVCGIVGQEQLGFNAVSVDVAAARAAIGTLAHELNKSVEETAESIIRIAVARMFAKVSALVTKFGIDPRTMSMLPFGGAGPMMGCLLARELGMRRTVVPVTPGVLSALGGLLADFKNDFIKMLFVELDDSVLPELRSGFADLRERGAAWLRDDQGYEGEAELQFSADMRYRGQSFEIEVALTQEVACEGTAGQLKAAFHAAHEAMYGHSDPDAAVQLVSLRLVASGKTPRPEMKRIRENDGTPPSFREIEIWAEGKQQRVPLYVRAGLLAGHTFAGPAVVAQDDTTTFIPSGTDVTVDAFGNLDITFVR
ncbi:hydantoinase/oxoprolinase family protein [Burkholderia sp. Ac-20365]|uniref:hydantoinase/oxoprolinase family protein n=1 Tax=Burkholderia sp. Ac-20365 TaxID=2703897 RepID=UPI00197C5B33|nr:hydantoinase/oxoprolinase family protein [Burkholderia sp. Ac-20365]MBN3766186.1 hydantoinase/oxoprolinase family protein [Burkholderia sp. Ac-20365]